MRKRSPSKKPHETHISSHAIQRRLPRHSTKLTIRALACAVAPMSSEHRYLAKLETVSMPHGQQARTEGLESHKHCAFPRLARDVQDDGHLRRALQLLQLRLHPAQDLLQHVGPSQAQALV